MLAAAIDLVRGILTAFAVASDPIRADGRTEAAVGWPSRRARGRSWHLSLALPVCSFRRVMPDDTLVFDDEFRPGPYYSMSFFTYDPPQCRALTYGYARAQQRGETVVSRPRFPGRVIRKKDMNNRAPGRNSSSKPAYRPHDAGGRTTGSAKVSATTGLELVEKAKRLQLPVRRRADRVARNRNAVRMPRTKSMAARHRSLTNTSIFLVSKEVVVKRENVLPHHRSARYPKNHRGVSRRKRFTQAAPGRLQVMMPRWKKMSVLAKL